jgi:transcriptional regulatory protein RtcR
VSASTPTQSAPRKPVVVIGFLGTTLDAGAGANRWSRWRPTVSLCQHEDFVVDRLELLHPRGALNLARTIQADIASVSPETKVVCHLADPRDPWDFEEVYNTLHSFTTGYPFDPDAEDYLIHITTGTHVAQICSFILTEARYFPARLIQTAPPKREADGPGLLSIIDLDLSRYDRIASRFEREHRDAVASLKSGIETRNPTFNALIDRIEHVAAQTVDPILIMGPTGAGKSRLARRIFEVRKHRRMVVGQFVEVNCATLRGDAAMSALFGHRKGAYTGATSDRPGLLRSADGGMLFLDEIGELGLDEQAMLLRAVEEKKFLPLGADTEVASDFQLITGTNRDLAQRVRDGTFRDDLLARINLWTFRLPGLRDRPEDIEPNLEFELEAFARTRGDLVRFSKEARASFLAFATSPDSAWTGNFRDLNAALTRMATLAPGGRITESIVREEIDRLRALWAEPAPGDEDDSDTLAEVLSPQEIEALDLFDRVQLAAVVRVCKESRSLADAGRRLFAASRTRRTSANDSDRVRKYLARFGLDWDAVTAR